MILWKQETNTRPLLSVQNAKRSSSCAGFPYCLKMWLHLSLKDHVSRKQEILSSLMKTTTKAQNSRNRVLKTTYTLRMCSVYQLSWLPITLNQKIITLFSWSTLYFCRIFSHYFLTGGFSYNVINDWFSEAELWHFWYQCTFNQPWGVGQLCHHYVQSQSHRWQIVPFAQSTWNYKIFLNAKYKENST